MRPGRSSSEWPAVEVIITGGGARAIRDIRAGEVMHPGVGPTLESERVYACQSRLGERLSEGAASRPLVLFDIGLGAASNALAAWRVSEAAPPGVRPLHILSFERDLEALRLAMNGDHAEHFGLSSEAGEAARAILETGAYSTERTRWRLCYGGALESLAALVAHPEAQADIVFWDPFSPKSNPELWTWRAFATLRSSCREGCTVFTYSASTAARSALLLAGFAVGRGISVGNKSETTCAATRVEDLAMPLDQRWLQRLGRSSAPFPPDAPQDAFQLIARLPQFA